MSCSFLSTKAFAQISSDECINYDDLTRTIFLKCHSFTLTDIHNILTDKNILQKQPDKIWLLKANIVIEDDATLYINSTDTKWLKIESSSSSSEQYPYWISIYGNLYIDSIKLTSWDSLKDDYVKYVKEIREGDNAVKETPYDAIPRPYLQVEGKATGSTHITNSEIAYLGYDCKVGGCSGLSFYSGKNNTVSGNEIHHNRFGVYSNGVSEMIIENNHIHHNFMYGLDPHTGTNNMLIKNNSVHDHGAMGIICSLDCYNITIEGNEVYSSSGSGIMLSKNMSDSVVKDNNVHDESKCIFLSQSNNNEIYDNTLRNCEDQGIYLHHDSFNNTIYNNTVINSTEGIKENEDSKGNNISNNNVITQ
ncbi:MAG: right-handed parallel beta-helix repeat-containing protein [Candidatus Nitrosocosmicus sp.]|nr:right-handed parallel beta-helix repeat-containing protein [Candidatus Nitrosocosmicus sp.]